MDRKILDNGDTTGPTFSVMSERAAVVLSKFQAGAAWTIQRLTPDASGTEWVTTAHSFMADGEYIVGLVPGRQYRLTGGVAGAEAWIADVVDQTCG